MDNDKSLSNLFRQVLRIERRLGARGRVGAANTPAEEFIRFRQHPHLHHVANDIAAISGTGTHSDPTVIDCHWPSLVGPNGPLPHYVTEQAIQERLSGGAQPLCDLLDMIGSRFIAHFYRAWALGTPLYGLSDSGPSCVYKDALRTVHGPAPMLALSSQRADASCFLGYPRSRGLLAHLLQESFGLPAEIIQFVGSWLPIPRDARPRLGEARGSLGQGMVIGTRVWDRRYRIRVRFLRANYAKYLGFLPAQPLRMRLDALLRGFLRSHVEWDVEIELPTAEVLPAHFGAGVRLGLTGWLGKPSSQTVAVRLPKVLYNPAISPAVS